MTIKSSGLIGISDINTELAFNVNTPMHLNNADVRALLGKASGLISLSDAYGKTKPITSGSTNFIVGVAADVDSTTNWIYGFNPAGNGHGSISPGSFRGYAIGEVTSNMAMGGMEYCVSLAGLHEQSFITSLYIETGAPGGLSLAVEFFAQANGMSYWYFSHYIDWFDGVTTRNIALTY